MEDLPKGLLATATQLSSELDSLDVIDLAQIIQLWKSSFSSVSLHPAASDLSFYSLQRQPFRA
jgi:hypothetical protein